jgi:hypothetical protein
VADIPDKLVSLEQGATSHLQLYDKSRASLELDLLQISRSINQTLQPDYVTHSQLAQFPESDMLVSLRCLGIETSRLVGIRCSKSTIADCCVTVGWVHFTFRSGLQI